MNNTILGINYKMGFNVDFLDQADIDLICGGNIARLMGVGQVLHSFTDG